AEGNPGQADNARTINQTSALVDNYRGILINMVQPRDGTILIEGTNATLSANVETDEGPVTKVEFFDKGLNVGESLLASFTFQWTNTTPGRHFLSARASVQGGLSQTSSAIVVGVKPSNDEFANRRLLPGLSASATTVLTFATAEPNEPAHFGLPSNTAWWTWTAPPRPFIARVTASGSVQHRPRVAIYTGSDLSDLR